MKTVYTYVLNTLADWEIGLAVSELNSQRFFINPGKFEVKTLDRGRYEAGQGNVGFNFPMYKTRIVIREWQFIDCPKVMMILILQFLFKQLPGNR